MALMRRATSTLFFVVAVSVGAPCIDAAAQPTSGAIASKGASSNSRAQVRWETAEAKLQAKCAPKESSGNTLAVQAAMVAERRCLEGLLASEIVQSRSRARGDTKRRVSDFESQEQAWKQLLEAVCNIDEELTWVSFADAHRDDGTMRGQPYMACAISGLRERIFFWQSLGLDDPRGLRAHTPTEETKLVRELMHVENASEAILARRVHSLGLRDGDLEPHYWLELASMARSARSLLEDVARRTCEAWPAFASAFDGAECLRLGQRYLSIMGGSLGSYE
jgi:hypothetical protein